MTATEPNSDRQKTPPGVSDRWPLAALLIFTLIVRGTVLWLMRDNLNQDPDAYREIAENLLVYGEFALGKPNRDNAESQPRPTAYRPPLYPVLLSNLPTADGGQLSLAKVAALHLLLGVATVWLTWLTARRVHEMHLEPRVAGSKVPFASHMHPMIAGLLVACDPLLLNQQTLVMTETLAAFLTILSLWCLARFDSARTPFNAALTGGTIGLAVLCRPTFLPWLGLVGLGMMVARGSNAERGTRNAVSRKKWAGLVNDVGRRTMNLASLGVVAAIVVSPWAIRNQQRFGKPIITTTHGGYTLLLGNNQSFYEWLNHDETGIPWSAAQLTNFMETQEKRQLHLGWDRSQMYGLHEGNEDRGNYELAMAAIKRDPTSFVRACVYRVCQLWSPLPHKLTTTESTSRRLLRYATCIWYCGVFALAAVGIWQLRWQILQPPWVWGVLLCLVFTAVHTFYWTNMRMRAPLMPFIALVSASSLSKRKS